MSPQQQHVTRGVTVIYSIQPNTSEYRNLCLETHREGRLLVSLQFREEDQIGHGTLTSILDQIDWIKIDQLVDC